MKPLHIILLIFIPLVLLVILLLLTLKYDWSWVWFILTLITSLIVVGIIIYISLNKDADKLKEGKIKEPLSTEVLVEWFIKYIKTNLCYLDYMEDVNFTPINAGRNPTTPLLKIMGRGVYEPVYYLCIVNRIKYDILNKPLEFKIEILEALPNKEQEGKIEVDVQRMSDYPIQTQTTIKEVSEDEFGRPVLLERKVNMTQEEFEEKKEEQKSVAVDEI